MLHDKADMLYCLKQNSFHKQLIIIKINDITGFFPATF